MWKDTSTEAMSMWQEGSLLPNIASCRQEDAVRNSTCTCLTSLEGICTHTHTRRTQWRQNVVLQHVDQCHCRSIPAKFLEKPLTPTLQLAFAFTAGSSMGGWALWWEHKKQDVSTDSKRTNKLIDRRQHWPRLRWSTSDHSWALWMAL